MIDSIILLPLVGSIIVSIGTAIVGTFSYLRKESLLGDALAHSVLPGICIAFIVFESKHPLILFSGALVFAFISQWIITFVSNNSKLKKETVLGVVLSVFFGFGIFLLTIIQHSGSGSQSGLDKFLFGKASTISYDDVSIYLVITISIVVLSILFFKELLASSFDSIFSKTIYGSTTITDIINSVMVVFVIVSGIQTAGIILVSALLITPAVIARCWTNSAKTMIYLACISSILCSVIGVLLSAYIPKVPTGPIIVFCLSIVFFASITFAPKSFLWKRLFFAKKMHWKVFDENVIKSLFVLITDTQKFRYQNAVEILSKKYNCSNTDLEKSLLRLHSNGYILKNEGMLSVTKEGIAKAKRLVKLHRLWEVYLVEYVHIAADHVHEDAESLEHIITPEIENKLELLLQFPEHCPHQKTIPYST